MQFNYQLRKIRLSIQTLICGSIFCCSINTAIADTDISQWTGSDIGTANIPGSHTINGNIITLNGSGNDIWNSSDDFYYVYTEITGDATLITKVHSVDHTHPWAKGAIMFRETLNAGSINVALDYSAHEHVALQWRPLANKRSYYWGRNVGSGPVWLKLVREGDLFTGYYSLNGEDWTLTTSKEIPMNAQVYVGLASSPHIDTANTIATFSDFNLVQSYNTKAKVYLMAGQSNMQGHGSNSELPFTSGADLVDVRDDVFMQNVISNTRALSGLAPGYGERNSKFGVELKMGNVLGDVLDEPVYMFKGSKGGTTLDNTAHWRPLAHGGEEGNLYDQLMTGFTQFLQDEFISNNIEYEIAGFVWFQGYNDTFGTEHLYENHLRNLISSVRSDLNQPNLPVIITQINDNRGSAGDIVMAAQATVANEDEFASLVYTGDQRPYYHYGSDSYVVIGDRIAQAALPILNYAGGVKDEYTVIPNTQLVNNDGVLQNDLGVPTSAQLATSPTYGMLTFNHDGSFVYTPNANYIGQDTFSYYPIKNGRLSNVTPVRLWVRDQTNPLVLHYTFDDFSDTAPIDVVSGVTALEKGGFGSYNQSGKIGNAAYFNGSQFLHYMIEYPVYSFLDLQTTQDFSIALWIKPDANINSEQILMSNKYFYNSRSGFAFTLSDTGMGIKGFVGAFDHETKIDKTQSLVAGNTDLADGNWHHVAVTFGFSENTMRLYIDGAEVGNKNLTNIIGEINKYESAIADGSGGGNGNSNAYKGFMDDVRLYRKILSPIEIQALYNMN